MAAEERKQQQQQQQGLLSSYNEDDHQRLLTPSSSRQYGVTAGLASSSPLSSLSIEPAPPPPTTMMMMTGSGDGYYDSNNNTFYPHASTSTAPPLQQFLPSSSGAYHPPIHDAFEYDYNDNIGHQLQPQPQPQPQLSNPPPPRQLQQQYVDHRGQQQQQQITWQDGIAYVQVSPMGGTTTSSVPQPPIYYYSQPTPPLEELIPGSSSSSDLIQVQQQHQQSQPQPQQQFISQPYPLPQPQYHYHPQQPPLPQQQQQQQQQQYSAYPQSYIQAAPHLRHVSSDTAVPSSSSNTIIAPSAPSTSSSSSTSISVTSSTSHPVNVTQNPSTALSDPSVVASAIPIPSSTPTGSASTASSASDPIPVSSEASLGSSSSLLQQNQIPLPPSFLASSSNLSLTSSTPSSEKAENVPLPPGSATSSSTTSEIVVPVLNTTVSSISSRGSSSSSYAQSATQPTASTSSGPRSAAPSISSQQQQHPQNALQMQQRLHFNPPPPAVATFVTPQTRFGANFARSSPLDSTTPVRPMTIDLNPSANLTRSTGNVNRGRSSTSASLLQQQLAHQAISAQQQMVDPAGNYRSQLPPEQQHLQLSSGPSALAGDWDPQSPMRDMHARFQSASNVRGALSETFDNSPARFGWDAHGRMSTMDSIASTQWSPAVNDMYRLVDPLRPVGDTSTIPSEQGISSSPVRYEHDFQPRELGRRVSSFSSIASGPIPSPPVSTYGAPVAPIACVTGPSPYMVQQPLHGARSHPHLRLSIGQAPPGQFANPMYTTYRSQGLSAEEDDSESRRASTATSISSASLVSPRDGQIELPGLGTQMMQGPTGATYYSEAPSQFAQVPQGVYGYREYLVDPYEPSPPSGTTSFPITDLGLSKSSSPMPYGPSPTHTQVPLPSSLEGDAGAWPTTSVSSGVAAIDIPTAQLERQTLSDNLVSSSLEQKRKRTPSGRHGSGGTAPSRFSFSSASSARPVLSTRTRSANDTLAPLDQRSHRRLSSPVLSVRPGSSGEGDELWDDDDEEEEEGSEHEGANNAYGGTYGQSEPTLTYVQYQLPPSQLPSAPLAAGPSNSSYISFAPNAAAQQAHAAQAHAAPVASGSSGMQVSVHALTDAIPVTNLHRTKPIDEDDPELGRPRRQRLRFDNDYYTPEWVRGDGAKKEGFCDLCFPGKWLQLKNSAFWYHRQYTHGISSVSGAPFSPPAAFRQSTVDGSTEAQCHQCKEWVMYTTKKQNASEDAYNRIPTNWFKHAHKCHFQSASRKGEKSRGKRRKVSGSPEPEG